MRFKDSTLRYYQFQIPPPAKMFENHYLCLLYRVTVAISCQMDFSQYPFDSHVCTFQVGSCKSFQTLPIKKGDSQEIIQLNIFIKESLSVTIFNKISIFAAFINTYFLYFINRNYCIFYIFALSSRFL